MLLSKIVAGSQGPQVQFQLSAADSGRAPPTKADQLREVDSTTAAVQKLQNDLRAQIRDQEAALSAPPPTAAANGATSVPATLQAPLKRMNELQSQIEQLTFQRNQLQRTRDLQQTSYDLLRSRLAEQQVNGVISSVVDLGSAASDDATAASRSPLRMMALLAGAAAAIAAVLGILLAYGLSACAPISAATPASPPASGGAPREAPRPTLIAKFARLTLLKNAVANLMRGSASALVALLLPPFLVRTLAPPQFAAWSLVLQLSAYAGFLDFGIQTAVGRFVAHANELRDIDLRDRIVSTAMWLLGASAALALALVGILAWQLPNLFREMPPALYGEARLALLLVGGSTALGLPASVFIGIFVGLQRNEVPAAIIGGGRLLGAVAVLGVVALGGGLAAMGGALATVNVLSYALQYAAVRRWAPEMHVQPRAASRSAAREILAYCASLSIWSFATLLVQGVDTTVVGFFDFAAVGYYTVAASFITVILGMQNALFSALISEAAIISARGDGARLGGLLTQTTRYGMFALLATGLPLLVAAGPILSLWVGPAYASGAAPAAASPGRRQHSAPVGRALCYDAHRHGPAAAGHRDPARGGVHQPHRQRRWSLLHRRARRGAGHVGGGRGGGAVQRALQHAAHARLYARHFGLLARRSDARSSPSVCALPVLAFGAPARCGSATTQPRGARPP